METFPKYRVKSSRNGQFYWNLHSVNGEIILTSSETYMSKQGCERSIASSRRNVADSNFVRKQALNEQYYFLQKAGNGEELGKSEMYTTAYARDNGIAAVKRDAPVAGVEDATVKRYV